MTYAEAMSYIASLEPRGWRLGLDRMAELVRRAGLEDAIGTNGNPKFIHVAGTNGKGSTTAYLQSLLVESGYRTGAFFSPYVIDPRERIQFGRELIERQSVARLTEELMPVAESLSDTEFGGVTEFEFKTALGFAYWKERHCEWVALEVGLGGRMDSTNVITPAATIITSISLDHTSILGNSLREIALEKAGIIKHGKPVLLGNLPNEAMEAVVERADALHAPIWTHGKEITWQDGTVTTPRRVHRGLSLGIRGERQEINLSLAIAALDAAGVELEQDVVSRGSARATIPGRLQEVHYRGATLVFDGAHNSESAQVLAASLAKHYPERSVLLVTNMVQGHDPEPFFRPLLPLVDRVLVVPIGFHRAQPVDSTVDVLRNMGADVAAFRSVKAGIDEAAEHAGEAIVLVTGSFYLVGEILNAIDTGSPAQRL